MAKQFALFHYKNVYSKNCLFSWVSLITQTQQWRQEPNSTFKILNHNFTFYCMYYQKYNMIIIFQHSQTYGSGAFCKPRSRDPQRWADIRCTIPVYIDKGVVYKLPQLVVQNDLEFPLTFIQIENLFLTLIVLFIFTSYTFNDLSLILIAKLIIDQIGFPISSLEYKIQTINLCFRLPFY